VHHQGNRLVLFVRITTNAYKLDSAQNLVRLDTAGTMTLHY